MDHFSFSSYLWDKACNLSRLFLMVWNSHTPSATCNNMIPNILIDDRTSHNHGLRIMITETKYENQRVDWIRIVWTLLKAVKLLNVYSAANCFVNQSYHFASDSRERFERCSQRSKKHLLKPYDSCSHTMLGDKRCTSEVLQEARAAKVACYKILQYHARS